MNVTVSDLANYAQILSVPLTVLAWLVTKERFAKFWKKRLKIIFTAFGIITLIGLWRLGWLSWLSFRVSWPIWSLILLSFSWLAVARGIAAFDNLFRKEVNELDYTTDEIFGVEWNWCYVRGQLKQTELAAFCPNQQCACRLEQRSSSDERVYVSLICEHCGFVKHFEWSRQELNRRVVLEIERRLRTGEFKRRLDQRK